MVADFMYKNTTMRTLSWNEKSSEERVDQGLLYEDRIARFLTWKLDWDLINVSPELDMEGKTDRRKVNEFAGKITGYNYVQIKARDDSKEDYRDMLIAQYQPFFGRGHKDNQIARDKKGLSDIYVCWCAAIDKLAIMYNKTHRKLSNHVLLEWQKSSDPFHHKTSNGNMFWYSTEFPGIQLCRNYDGRSGIPKLVCYVPIEYCEKLGGEIIPCTKKDLVFKV
jgi:hypothetical protein